MQRKQVKVVLRKVVTSWMDKEWGHERVRRYLGMVQFGL